MFDRVRARTGRIATIAGTTGLAAGIFMDAATAPAMAATVAAAGIGLATNPKIWRAPKVVRPAAMVIYAAPHTGCLALLVGERLVPTASLPWLAAQAGAVALWTGATWWVRPGRLARDLADEAVLQEAAEAAEAAEEEVQDEEEQAVVPLGWDSPDETVRWWALKAAGEGGIAPGTVLLDYQQIGPRCVAAVIGSATPGDPVPEIKAAGLSALLDIEEEEIAVEAVPGRGAGVRLLVLGERPKSAEPEADEEGALWAEIAEVAMPGVELVEARTYEIGKELT